MTDEQIDIFVVLAGLESSSKNVPSGKNGIWFVPLEQTMIANKMFQIERKTLPREQKYS